MALRLNGSTSGYVEIDAPAVAGDNTLTLPSTPNGSLVALDSSGRLGIGTSSPLSYLNVVGTGTTAVDFTATDAQASANTSLLVHNNTNNNDAFSQLILRQRITNQTDIRLTAWNGDNPYFTIAAQSRLSGQEYAKPLLTIGATSGNVGIGTTSPDGTLHVHTASAGTLTPWANADDLIVENNGPTGISIIAPNDEQAQIIFANPSDNIGSIIRWKRDENELQVGTHKTDGFLTFRTAIGQERARIDSGGRLLVGTATSVTSSVSQQSLLQVYSTSSSASSIQIGNYTAGVNAAGLHFDKSRGTTVGTNTILQSDDNIGSIKFNGADGTNLVRAAAIDCVVDGTPAGPDPGPVSMPGRLVFSTTSAGASTPTERARIDSSGTFRVTGNIQKIGTYTDFSDYWGGSGANGAIFMPYGFIGSGGGFELTIGCNGYRNDDAGFTYMDLNGNTDTTSSIDLNPEGYIDINGGTASGVTVPFVARFDGRTKSFGVNGNPNNYQVIAVTGTLNQTDGSTTEVFSARANLNAGSSTLTVYQSRCGVLADKTVANYRCYDANPSTNSGTITNQYGFTVQSGLTQGATNYGFWSNIAASANRWNFYANGTAANYFAGTIASLGSYNDTTASAANVFIASNGDIQRSTSSIRYKTDVEEIDTNYADNVIFNARPVWYRSLCEADNAGWSYYGLIAEEIAELDPRLVFWGRPTKEVLFEEAKPAVFDDEGNEIESAQEASYTNVEDADAELRPEGVQYDRLTVMLIDVVQRQQKTIEALEARIAALEAN